MRSKAWMGVAAVCGLPCLTGCAGFFVNTSSSSGGSTSTSGDYVYVVNSTTNTLAEYAVGSSSLTSVSGSPYTLTSGIAASSVTVSRPDTFVYVGGVGIIACYSIGSTGALTLNSSGGTTSSNTVAMDTSPDGKWLVGLDTLSAAVYVYAINTSTGALTLTSTTPYATPGNGTAVPKSVRFAASGALLAVGLGTGGDIVYTFNTSTGVPTQAASIKIGTAYTDNAVAFDASSAYLYVARGLTSSVGSPVVASYSVTSAGALTSVGTTASGNAPYALQFDSTGAYLYAANRSDGTVSGYTATNGTLTAIASSPYTSSGSVLGLAKDNSGKYVVAMGSTGTKDVTLYALDALTAGQLDAVATASSGSAGNSGIAATY